LSLLPLGLLLLCAASPPPGASSCSGCHAPASAATEVPVIAGQSADQTAALLEAFRNGTRPATVMNRIAKGFTPQESQAIAVWWAAQR